MVSRKQVHGKGNNSLLTVAVLLFVLGGAALYEGSNDRTIRPLGAIACMASAYLIRKSKGQSQYGSADTTVQIVNPEVPSRPGPLMWALGAVSLLFIGISYSFLRSDAAKGYHQVWPVYLFGGAIVVGGSVLSCLVARIM